MRAAVVHRTGPAHELQAGEWELPVLGSHEIRVRTAFAAVNPVDLKTRSGALDMGLAFPAVLGWDIAGTVDSVGAEVSDFQVGDQVMGMLNQPARPQGTYAEFVSAPAVVFAPVPTGLGLDVAAAAPLAALTAAQGVDTLNLPDQADVLVTGAAGAVGRVVVQLLRRRGHMVSGLARATDAEDLAALGVRAVHLASIDVPERSFDAVFDTAGLGETLSAVRDGGEFLSTADGEPPAPQRGIMPRRHFVEENGAQLGEIAQLLADGALTVPVGGTYPLADAAAAHTELGQGGVRAKILLAP